MKKIASLFLIFATILMLSACSASKPEDVAKEFVEASYKGDADKMLSLIHFPEEEKAIDEKIKTETKEKDKEEKKPMEVMKETMDYTKKLPKHLLN